MSTLGKVRTGVVLLLICVAAAIWHAGRPDATPNILVIMADDLGFNDLAINNNNPEMDTPSMDQLAREGVRFTRHYASQVCSPARAAFLTGMYPERLGYIPNGPGISQDVVTLPDRLREAGYTTWHIGKWHVGDLERTAWPDYQGFDHWFGFLNQWRLAGEHEDGELKLVNPRYGNPWLQGDSEPGRFYPGHLEDILTDKAIAVISDLHDHAAPWFLNLWFYAPHGPVQPAPEYAARYPDTPKGRYRALVNQLDTNIGRVIAHLDTLGVLQDTIVVVVSDNGGADWYRNLPYRGKKSRLDEGGLRTPLIIRWPHGLEPGQVYADTVSIQDIYPSLLAAIGLESPAGMDGESFLARVAHGNPPPQKPRFWEAGKGSWGVLSADGAWRMLRPPPFMGVELAPVLFDLIADPYALKPLQSPPAEPFGVMLDSYKGWYRDVHRVRTEFVPDGRGGGELRGAELLRTPGFGGYTVGMAVPRGATGRIVSQEGVWSLHRDGETFTARFGDLVLSGVPDSPRACHSVVLSGRFRREVGSLSGSDQVALALYLDGEQVDVIEQEGAVIAANPGVATLIWGPDLSALDVPLTPPVILNTRLDASTPWSVSAFSGELCAGS